MNESHICQYVDHYVQKIMDYTSSQNERNFVCLEVADLYYKVRAYDKAISYLKIYLGSSNEALAHGLMGHCYIRKEPPDLRRGLYHLNRSMQLNPCQPDLIADVSRLLLEHIQSAERFGRNWLALIDQFEGTGPLVAALRMRVDPADSNGCSYNSCLRHMERAVMRIQISQALQDKAFQKERELNNRVIFEFRKGLRTLKTQQAKLTEELVKAVGEIESLSDDQAIPQDTAIADLIRSLDMKISVSKEDEFDRPTYVPAIISQDTPFVQSTKSHSSTKRAISRTDFADQPLQDKGFMESTGSQSATGSLQPMSWADIAEQQLQNAMLAKSMALYAPTNSRIPVFRADVAGQDKRSMVSTGSQPAILTRVPIFRADVADQRLKNTPIVDSMVTWAPANSLVPVFSSDDGPVHACDDQQEVKFSSGAKLFLYVGEKWKVCGTGLVKILRHKTTGVSRVLMHRHQTGEILANYQIAHGMTLSPFEEDEDQQSFLWAVNDFADEQLTLVKFLIRLAAPKRAVEFRVAFEKAIDEAQQTNALPPNSPCESFVTSTSQNKEKFKAAADVSLPTAAPPQASGPLAPSAFANFGNHLFLDGAFDDSGTNSPPFTTAPIEEDPLEDQSASDGTEPEEEQDISDACDIEIFWSGPQIVDDLVFGDKVELYFFDHAALTWKACGPGYLSVLEHPLVTGLYRLKVRQEQTDKLLLNMSVKRSTKIYWNPSMAKTLMWTGSNLVDGEGNITAVGVEERVACSFATEQQALVLLSQLEDGH